MNNNNINRENANLEELRIRSNDGFLKRLIELNSITYIEDTSNDDYENLISSILDD